MLDDKSAPKKRTKTDDRTERVRPAPKPNGTRSFLNVDPEQQFEIVRGLASPVRVRILRLLRLLKIARYSQAMPAMLGVLVYIW